MSANTQIPKTKDVLKYMLLPGILPRVKELGGTGFGYLAFLFAQVYRAVRILPPNHPYTNIANIGTFSVLQVIRAAASHVKFDRKHIDQVFVFFLMILGALLVIAQFVLLIVALLTSQAFAADTAAPSFTSMFVTPSPEGDVAFMMLDYVFGIPGQTTNGTASGFFGSTGFSTGTTAFQQGMHALFNFYNLALLLVAVVIFVYYVIVVVIETAQTGVPFGRRFSKIYAPMRLVMAVGLLVPLANGFNASQYIVLYAAKWGSSFATNGWIQYNRNLQNPMGVANSSLVARPSIPAVDELAYFSSIYHACREMYKIWAPTEYLTPGQNGITISAYVVVNGNAQEFTSGYSYSQAKQDFRSHDMEIVLGERDTTKHADYAGGVRPYCGKITVSLNNNNPAISGGGKDGADKNGGSPDKTGSETGVRAVEEMYFKNIQEMLSVSGSLPFRGMGERVARVKAQQASQALGVSREGTMACYRSDILRDGDTCGVTNWKPPTASFTEALTNFRTQNNVTVGNAFVNYRDSMSFKLSTNLEKRGWGGAGIWYNNIADINGTFTSAVYAVPTVSKFPEVMEFVRNWRQRNDKGTGMCEMFEPNLGGANNIKFNKSNEAEMAVAFNNVYKYFICDRQTQGAGGGSTATGGAGDDAPATASGCGETIIQRSGASTRGLTANVIVDVIGLIFGINGLFDIRACSKADVATGQPLVHPLAQLSTVGKSLVENSIRSMAGAVFAAFGGGLVGALNSAAGAALMSLSGMLVGIATIGLSAGFVLYYILPFLPFIYFFFAVGAWVKSIFEAMVGAPLWALAHLKIDGEGFSGKAASQGYLLILEIFLRPIVTLFGLIGGVAIFGAMAVALNNLFELVVSNITGGISGSSTASISTSELENIRRGVIDQFFFTVMYAILLYMLATSSFKMIDTIPRGFMRWLGTGVSKFNDNTEDPTQHLTQYAALGGAQVSGQVFSGVRQGAGALGQALGAGAKAATSTGTPSGGGTPGR